MLVNFLFSVILGFVCWIFFNDDFREAVITIFPILMIVDFVAGCKKIQVDTSTLKKLP